MSRFRFVRLLLPIRKIDELLLAGAEIMEPTISAPFGFRPTLPAEN